MVCKPMEKAKVKHKKGLWSPDEDQKLKDHILNHGYGCWSYVPIKAGLQRSGKSCRLRWINYLRPGLKRGVFSTEEEQKILTLHGLLGNKWSQIAQNLPGRTDNEIKNYWHCYLKKKLAKLEETEATNISHAGNIGTSSPSSLQSTTRISSLESFENMEGSLTDTDQSITRSLHFPNEVCPGKLPKIFFAEWLSSDQFHGHDLVGNSGNPIVDKGVLNYDTNFQQDAFMQSLMMNEELSGSSDFQALSNGAVHMFCPEFKSEDQIVNSGFADYISAEFEISNRIMFM